MSFIRFFSLFIIFTLVLHASVGKVSLLKGGAFVLRSSQTLPLQTGSRIEEKDTVSTEKTGQIQIVFEDKTVITLGNSSTFKIEEYLNQEQKPKAKFSFAQGTFKTITGKIGKRAPENFTLETKTATIGIRGTIIRGKLGERIDKIMCEKGAIGVRSHLTGREVLVPMGRVIVMPHDAPPLPVRDVQPSDLTELSLNGDPTPPNSAPANGSTPSENTPADNPLPSVNQAPLSGDNFQPSNNALAPTAPPFSQTASLLQNFTPEIANTALETSFETQQQDTVTEEILIKECPSGTTGTYPDCVALTCPSGTTGTYPDCVALTCPSGTTGTYPDCVALTCPSGTTGTYPDCVALTCPSGMTGTYPDCVALTCPSGTTGTYPDCVALTCPSGTTGTYPDCVALTCPSGTTGTYPDCVALTCPSGTTGRYPNCTTIYVPPQQCPTGTAGTYPECTAEVNFSLKGLATSRSTNGYGFNNLSLSLYTDSTATGSLTLSNYNSNILDLNSSIVSGSSAQNFTLSDFNTTGTWLGTNDSSPDSSIIWGKWTSVGLDNNVTLVSGTNNFWVAGSDLIGGASHISSLITNQAITTYTYAGKVFGSVYNQATYYPIDPSTDLTNEIRLKFDFGNGYGYLSGNGSYIRFTVNGLYWYMPVASEVEILNGSFTGYYVDSMANGQISGFFNGTNAGSIGGAFNATYTDQNSSLNSYAFGVFAGTKQTCPAGSIGTYPGCLPVTLSGMATSSHNDSNGALLYSGNDTFSILVDPNDSASSLLSFGSDQNDFNTSLSGPVGASSFNDFNATQIWTDATWPNDYVAWGYWSSSEVDGNQTLLASNSNYWVGGKDAQAAANHISRLIANPFTTIYSYNGHVLGHVLEGGVEYPIDSANNTVNLRFNFGGGSNSLNPDPVYSTIGFTANGNTWMLSPNTAAVSNGKFSTSLSGDGSSTSLPSGTIAGQFFGNSAQAVGGTFKADAESKQAIGVFKAVR